MKPKLLHHLPARLVALLLLASSCMSLRAQWIERWSRPQQGITQIVRTLRDVGGNVIVVGSKSDDSQGVDFYAAKYSPAGVLLWTTSEHGSGHGTVYPWTAVLDASGNLVTCGRTGVSNSDYWTAKHARADGHLIWEHLYNGPASALTNYDAANCVTVDDNGNVIVSGISHNASVTSFPVGGSHGQWPSGYRDTYTAKYAAADGSLLWEKRYKSAVKSDDFVTSVVADSLGNVFVIGSSIMSTAPGDSQSYLLKYARDTGAILWTTLSSSPPYRSFSPCMLRIGSDGNCVATGIIINPSARWDIYTVKYDGASGAPVWERRVVPASYASVGGLVLDGHGNVIIGGSDGAGAYTAKYAAASGAILWEQLLAAAPGASNGVSDVAVALDGHGDVFTTSHAIFAYDELLQDTPASIFIVKRAGSSGTLLAETQYDLPSARDERKTSSPALTPAGDLFISMRTWDGEDYQHQLVLLAKPDAARPYDAWKLSHFGANAGAGGDLLDLEGDGSENLLEYALGADPLTESSAQHPAQSLVNVAGANHLALIFRRRIGTSGVSYTVECTSDLINGPWQPDPVPHGTPVDNGDGTETVTFRDILPLGGAPARFLRLRVNVP